MAQLTFNIPDPVVDEVIDTLAVHYEYTVEDGNKNAFVKGKLRDLIVRMYRMARSEQARDAASDAASVSYVDPDIT